MITEIICLLYEWLWFFIICWIKFVQGLKNKIQSWQVQESTICNTEVSGKSYEDLKFSTVIFPHARGAIQKEIPSNKTQITWYSTIRNYLKKKEEEEEKEEYNQKYLRVYLKILFP